MRKTLGVWIHVAHGALLLIAALNDPRERPSTRVQADPLAPRPLPRVDRNNEDATADAVEVLPRAEVVPHCPMPVWRPDLNVRYAGMAIGVDRPTQHASEPPPCVNPYSHAATSR
jgi:hypothetical protein